MLEKNTCLKSMFTIRIIRNILNRNNLVEDFPYITPEEAIKFNMRKLRHVMPNGVLVNMYNKNSLRSIRRTLTFENLKHNVIISCNLLK